MKELLEKKIEFKQKFAQKEQNNYKGLAYNNNCKKKEDYKSKLKLKKQNFRPQSQNKKN